VTSGFSSVFSESDVSYSDTRLCAPFLFPYTGPQQNCTQTMCTESCAILIGEVLVHVRGTGKAVYHKRYGNYNLFRVCFTNSMPGKCDPLGRMVFFFSNALSRYHIPNTFYVLTTIHGSTWLSITPLLLDVSKPEYFQRRIHI
jgi:hypothetical protein